MSVLLAAGCALALGVVLGLLFNAAAIRRLRKRNRELRAYIQDGAAPVKPETTKVIIWVCLVMGFAWVWCSYLLAWMDHPQIAESLSQVAVTEIIGVVLAYCIKSAVENLSKNNRWPDKGGAPEDQDTPEMENGRSD